MKPTIKTNVIVTLHQDDARFLLERAQMAPIEAGWKGNNIKDRLNKLQKLIPTTRQSRIEEENILSLRCPKCGGCKIIKTIRIDELGISGPVEITNVPMVCCCRE